MNNLPQETFVSVIALLAVSLFASVGGVSKIISASRLDSNTTHHSHKSYILVMSCTLMTKIIYAIVAVLFASLHSHALYEISFLTTNKLQLISWLFLTLATVNLLCCIMQTGVAIKCLKRHSTSESMLATAIVRCSFFEAPVILTLLALIVLISR